MVVLQRPAGSLCAPQTRILKLACQCDGTITAAARRAQALVGPALSESNRRSAASPVLSQRAEAVSLSASGLKGSRRFLLLLHPETCFAPFFFIAVMSSACCRLSHRLPSHVSGALRSSVRNSRRCFSRNSLHSAKACGQSTAEA